MFSFTPKPAALLAAKYQNSVVGYFVLNSVCVPPTVAGLPDFSFLTGSYRCPDEYRTGRIFYGYTYFLNFVVI